jgi:hypothetical protein
MAKGPEKGRGVENLGGKSGWAFIGGGIIIVPAQPTTVTMTVNNKAVKGRAGSLYSPRIREGESRKVGFRHREFWETRGMTLSKGLGINPTLFLHFAFPLQIAGFPWRARQDSNLRPSDS